MLQLNSFLLSALLMCTCLGAFAQETTPPAESTPTRDPSPYGTSYFLSHSAFQLPKGRFEYSNRMLLRNSLTYGITSNISITGGFDLQSIFIEEKQFWVNLKASTQLAKNLRVGVSGTSLSTSLFTPQFIENMAYIEGDYVNRDDFFDRPKHYNYVEAFTTFGSIQKNISVGVGFAESSGIVSHPVLTLGAVYPVSPRVSLMLDGKIGNQSLRYSSENTAYLQLNHTVTGGIRIAGRAHVFELGATFIDRWGNNGFVLPYFAFRKQF